MRQIQCEEQGCLRSKPRLVLAGFLAVTLVSSLPIAAEAQTALRWRLSPGDAFKVHVEQQTTSDVSFSGKQAVTQIDLTIDLTWKVTAADAEGFQVTQAIDRLQVKMTPAKGVAIGYDSADAKRLTGAAKDLETALKLLVGAKVAITMSDRGEILSAKVASYAANTANAAAGATQPAFSAASVQQLLKQSLVVLPANDVNPGDTWTTSTDIVSALGEFKQQTTYKLADAIEQDGRQVASIESATKLEPVVTAVGAPTKAGAKPAARPSLKSHEQNSTIQFSAEAGRVMQAESTQKLVTERPYRDTTIVVTLSSKQTTTIEPVRP